LLIDGSQPIYKQIIDTYKKQLIRGELKQGDKIPSQRELAEKLRVNPNTVQRAYREMESMNMVETLRGQGTFIAASDAMLRQFKEEMAQGLLKHFVSELRALGYHESELPGLLEEYICHGEEEKSDD